MEVIPLPSHRNPGLPSLRTPPGMCCLQGALVWEERCSGCRIQGFLFTDCRAEHIELPRAASLQQSSPSFIAAWICVLWAAARARLGNEGICTSSQEMLCTRACGEMIHSLKGGLRTPHVDFIAASAAQAKNIPKIEITEF